MSDQMPVFAIKAKDNLAVPTVEAYRALCVKHDLLEQAHHVEDARDEMVGWRLAHPDQCKWPDHAHVPAARSPQDEDHETDRPTDELSSTHGESVSPERDTRAETIAEIVAWVESKGYYVLAALIEREFGPASAQEPQEEKRLPDEEPHYSCTRQHCSEGDPENCWAQEPQEER